MRKVLFMGNSEVSIPSLLKLSKLYEVEVVTGPDKKRGRGKKIRPTPVKQKALELGLKVYTPEKVSEGEFLDFIKRNPPDIAVVVAFGEILKEEFLKIPKYGVVNLHFSLLPKYRGAEPLRRAILNGDKVTGVTTMYINPLLDQGDILLQREIIIDDKDTYGTLSKKLAEEGAGLLIETLQLMKEGKIRPIPQGDSPSSYAKKFTKEEMRIPWGRESLYIKNLVRALSPSPGAYTFFRGKRIKIYEVEAIPYDGGTPGKIVKVEKDRLVVACGDGAISIKKIQPEGKRIMSIDEFVKGYKPNISEMFLDGGE